MTKSAEGVQYWKDRFAREREEARAAQEKALDEIRSEFDKKIEKLSNENKVLREQPVMVETNIGVGFVSFAVGCMIGLIIGG